MSTFGRWVSRFSRTFSRGRGRERIECVGGEKRIFIDRGFRLTFNLFASVHHRSYAHQVHVAFCRPPALHGTRSYSGVRRVYTNGVCGGGRVWVTYVLIVVGERKVKYIYIYIGVIKCAYVYTHT